MVSKKRSVKLRESGNLEDLSRESPAVGEGLVFRVWPWYQFICEKTTPRPGEGCGSPHGANRRTRCICNQPRHPVEKHHGCSLKPCVSPTPVCERRLPKFAASSIVVN